MDFPPVLAWLVLRHRHVPVILGVTHVDGNLHDQHLLNEALHGTGHTAGLPEQAAQSTYLRGGASELLPRTLSWGLMLGEPRTRELVELRGGLEIQAAELAARRIDDVALERLAGYVERMKTSTNDFEAFKEADAHFHREIALASGNSVLEDILQSIRSLLRIWVDRGLRDEAHAARAAAEHEQILQALQKRDPDLARAVMENHMATAGRRLLDDFNPGNTGQPFAFAADSPETPPTTEGPFLDR